MNAPTGPGPSRTASLPGRPLRLRILIALLAAQSAALAQSPVATTATTNTLPAIASTSFVPASMSLPGLTPPIVIAELSFEQRRSLLYLLARLDQAEAAEELARSILAENPSDKQTLLTLASMYLDRKDAANTMRVAKLLRTHYPDDHQARYFEAAAHLLAKRAPDAQRILEDIKHKQFPKQLFPYQTDLASAAAAAGDWRTAIAACQEILRDHDISEKLRANVRSTLERLYRDHLPRFSAESTGALLDPGSVFRTSGEFRLHIANDHKLFAHYARFDTHLEAAPASGLAENTTHSQEAGAGIESWWSQRWHTEAWAGGGTAGAVGAASVSYLTRHRQEWTLEFQGNLHATDSLLLESLDGREHRLSLRASIPIDSRWSIAFDSHLREVRVDDEVLGQGFGATWTADYLVLRDTPELRTGYRGTYYTFNQQSQNTRLVEPAAAPGATPAQLEALLNGLVLEELHREGVFLLWRDRLLDPLFYHLVTTVEYAFELDALVYGASAGLRFYPRKSVEVTGEGGYLSNAKSGDLNSDQWQFNVALKYWF